MSNERNTSKLVTPPKLSDTQLVLLSAAAQRDDHCLTPTPNLKGGAAQKVADRLIAAGLVREIKGKPGAPVWRRDEPTAQSFALKLTAAGLKAIAVDDQTSDDEGAQPARKGDDDTRKKAASRRGSTYRDESPAKKGEASADDVLQHAESLAPSAPRPGSKTAEVIALLQQARGATIDELIGATGWLPHTTRAALTGLKKRGYEVARSRFDGVTRYRIASADEALNALSRADTGDSTMTPRNEKAA